MPYYARQNRQFEADILTIGCLAGVLRTVIAIYRDLPLQAVDLDFVVDCSLLVVFIIPLVLLRSRVRFEFISVPFSFLFIGFLCANWVVLKGIDGTGEYYFIGGIIMMALIHNGRWLVFFVVACVFLEAIMLYVWIYKKDWIALDNPMSTGIYHYLWVALVVTVALLYHKNQFDRKRESLREKKESLEHKIVTLKRQNEQLEEQKKMLQLSNDWLESNISQRSNKLTAQRESIEKYLSVTLFEIGPHVESTLISIDKLNDNIKRSQMGNLLIQSANHLQVAIRTVTHKIKQGVYYNAKN